MSDRQSKYAQTEVAVDSPAGRAKLIGPAWAIITIIAILGMIWVASKSLDVATKAVERQEPSAVSVPEPGHTPDDGKTEKASKNLR